MAAQGRAASQEDGFLYDMSSSGFYLGLGVRW